MEISGTIPPNPQSPKKNSILIEWSGHFPVLFLQPSFAQVNNQTETGHNYDNSYFAENCMTILK